MEDVIQSVIDPYILHKVLAIALLVEIITNFIKQLVPNLNKNYITTVAGVIGITLSFLSCVGIFETLGIPLKFDAIDYFLTGIIVSRGANFVHDFSNKLNA